MSVDGWLFAGFIACIALLSYYKRRALKTQRILGPFLYLLMYRSRVGLPAMKRVAARYEQLIHRITPVIIAVGVLGMAVVSIEVLLGLYDLLVNPASTGGVGLVLPFKAKGIFYVPFVYWILSIFVVVVVHEASHGILALANRVRIKSSGLACLAVGIPLIPAAFVEPDEKALAKRSPRTQMGVYAAGPFANILLGVVFLGIFAGLTNPWVDGLYEKTGVTVTKFAEGSLPIASSGFPENGVIISVDAKAVASVEDFQNTLKTKKPGDAITIATKDRSYATSLGESKDQPGKPYLGVFVEQARKRVIDGWWVPALEWVNALWLWLFAMNLGVGLFNLLPLGIVDGGRMLHVMLHRVFPEQQASRAWLAVSSMFLFAVVGSIVLGMWRA